MMLELLLQAIQVMHNCFSRLRQLNLYIGTEKRTTTTAVLPGVVGGIMCLIIILQSVVIAILLRKFRNLKRSVLLVCCEELNN